MPTEHPEPPTAEALCATCGDDLDQHPDEGMVRFEWADTARPEGFWYYREAGLQTVSVLRRDHSFEPVAEPEAAGEAAARETFEGRVRNATGGVAEGQNAHIGISSIMDAADEYLAAARTAPTREADVEALPELYIGNGLPGGDTEWSCWACEQPKGYPHDDECPGVAVALAAAQAEAPRVEDTLVELREQGWLLHLIPWEANGWRVEAFRTADTIAGYAVQHDQLPIVNEGASTIVEAVRLAADAALARALAPSAEGA